MRIEKAALTTKLVILALLIAATLALLSVRSRLDEAQEALDAVTRQVQAQTDINAELENDIATSGAGESILDIARERLGLVEPDEQVFVDVNH